MIHCNIKDIKNDIGKTTEDQKKCAKYRFCLIKCKAIGE